MENAPILVVDDDPALQVVLADGLRRLGYRVVDVASVTDADAALAGTEFGLVISDVHLAGNESLRWTERLLQNPRTPPVLLITGNPGVETAIRAANLPVAGYLAKPLSLAALAETVARLFALQNHRRELRSIAREIEVLAAGSLPEATAARLRTLAAALETEASAQGRSTGADARWQQAVHETIAVLEKTRDSFRSKDLGRLRRHLQDLVAGKPIAFTLLAHSLTELAPVFGG